MDQLPDDDGEPQLSLKVQRHFGAIDAVQHYRCAFRLLHLATEEQVRVRRRHTGAADGFKTPQVGVLCWREEDVPQVGAAVSVLVRADGLGEDVVGAARHQAGTTVTGPMPW